MTTQPNDESQHLTVVLPVEFSIAANWKDFVAESGGALTDFFVKGPGDGASAGISSLWKFTTSFRINNSSGYLAWVLTISGAAWALQQIDNFDEDERQRIVICFSKVIRSSKADVEQGIVVPLQFFDRPTLLPIYQKMSNSLVRELARGNSRNTKEFRHKLNSAFTLAVYEVFVRKPEFYQPLLSALEVPASTAASLEKSWKLYRSKLIYDFHVKPVFGQESEKVSLKQLYVPLRGVWGREGQALEEVEARGDYDSYSMVRIDEALDEWVEESDPADWLRLIGGGPGSGKSTTLKALASRAAASAHVRPLFIPLQNISIEGDLRDAVNKYFTDGTDSPFSQPPLSRASVEDGPPLLILFDGLDELAAPGEASKDVVNSFATRLHGLLGALTGAGNRVVKVVVSGRMPAFQSAKRFLPTPTHGAIETYGFLPSESGEVSDKIWFEDQRITWWKQYSAIKGEQEEVPEAFSSERLEGITNEPLLCYLLALAGFANKQWELAADNRNRIYSSLIDSIYDRGWGDGAVKRLGPGKTLSKRDFVKLMETIALAAWLGGDSRVATEEMFEQAIVITDAKSAWLAFTEDNGQDVTNLAMNFYLKANDKMQRGFEFTHKSFGEYLASRALLSVADEIAEQVPRRLDYALRDWITATRTGKPSYEMLSFLRDEMRLRMAQTAPNVSSRASQVKEAFQTLIEKVAVDGFPVLPSSESWRAQENQQSNAECALWMIVNSCATGLKDKVNPGDEIVKIRWLSETDLSDIVRRLVRIPDCDIILQCLSYLDASNQLISEFRALDIDLRYSILHRTIFVGVAFDGSFAGADMIATRFYMCRLDDVDFSNAHMDGVKLHVSSIKGITLNETSGSPLLLSPLTYASALNVSEEDSYEKLSVMVSHDSDATILIEKIEDRLAHLRKLDYIIQDGLAGDLSYRDRRRSFGNGS